MNSKVLVVADDKAVIKELETIFNFIDFSLVCSKGSELKKNVDKNGEYLVALIAHSDQEKLSAYTQTLNQLIPALPVYHLVEGDIESRPFAKGINGYIPLPLKYKSLLGRLREAQLEQKGGGKSRINSHTLIGSSPQLKEIQSLVRHVSMTDANVLLLGESGTGKEVVARAIHHLSLRNDRPFVAVNCGAIPAELLESELFGHEKGAFTGAINTRKGRFELAEGGTLFLDEIGDMPFPMQVKLLRVIQEKTFERVGGTKTIKTDVRLIAATHQDLEKKIGEGKFRMDLYYRLNVFPIELAPLRERPGDIPHLINEFATRMELERSSPVDFDDSAIQALMQNKLPGNVRELENLVERLAILYPGETITNQKLPQRYQSKQIETEKLSDKANIVSIEPAAPRAKNIQSLKDYLTNLEKSIIEEALEDSNWVVAKAAKSLSLQRTTLVEKIRKLDIQQEAD